MPSIFKGFKPVQKSPSVSEVFPLSPPLIKLIIGYAPAFEVIHFSFCEKKMLLNKFMGDGALTFI